MQATTALQLLAAMGLGGSVLAIGAGLAGWRKLAYLGGALCVAYIVGLAALVLMLTQ